METGAKGCSEIGGQFYTLFRLKFHQWDNFEMKTVKIAILHAEVLVCTLSKLYTA